MQNNIQQFRIQTQISFCGIQLLPQNMKNLFKVVNQILRYPYKFQTDINHQLFSLSHLHKSILIKYPQLIDRTQNITKCIQKNHNLLKHLIGMITIQKINQNSEYQYGLTDIINLLFQLVREWSDESKQQRNYILKIKQLLKKWHPQICKILVPGFMTGRILIELVQEGYQVQGNQENYDYFLAANFILNSCDKKYPIFPYIHNFCNHLNQNGPYTKIMIPDIIPKQIQFKSSVQIVTSLGEFCKLYSNHPSSWNIIITAFYLHKQSNIIQIINRIKNCLRKKGIWINYGHLIYENTKIQLNYQQMKVVLGMQGFQILEQGKQLNKIYFNKESLMNSEYLCSYFVVRKL